MSLKISSHIKRYNNKRTFRKVNCNINNIIIGPDIDHNFVIKAPKNLSIGDGAVINGDCYINAYGG